MRRFAERAEEGEKEPAPIKIDSNWCVQHNTPLASLTRRLTSFKDALRAFFQPVKNEDLRLDFYTMYKREAAEYDTDYIKKYDEDLNTTLIFVRSLSCPHVNHLIWSCRRVCSLPSARLSLSMSTRSFNLIPASNQLPSSSPSTSPRSPLNPPLFCLSKWTLPMRSSQPPPSCMRVS